MNDQIDYNKHQAPQPAEPEPGRSYRTRLKKSLTSMSDIRLFSHLSGDVSGGVSTAIMSILESIIFGMIAFAPLGPQYVPQGILAGIYSSVFVGFLASLGGGTPAMISGSRAPITLVFAAVISQLFASGRFELSQPEMVMLVLTFSFLVVFCSGLIQLLLGLLRFGSLIKFVPYPVVAGFMNGSAVLILIGQIWNFLGVPKKASLSLLWGSLHEVRPLTILISSVTALIMWHGHRITKRVHGSILGLAAGFALYYALQGLGLSSHLGPTIGHIPTDLPRPDYLLRFIGIVTDPSRLEIMLSLLPAAFSIAVLGSTDSLLTSLTMQSLTNVRSETNRELVGQGLGNMAAAAFGGIAAAGTLGRSFVNFQAGGRTRLSGMTCSVAMLLIVGLFSGVMAMIPQSLVAGIMLVVILKMIDPWSLHLFTHIFYREVTHRREFLANFLIILLVMVVTVWFNLVAAVGLGILVSVMIFVAKMSRSVIRRVYRGSSIRSKKQRDERFMELLRQHGSQVVIIELEGSIFFGSADSLALEVDRLTIKGVTYIILDMKRVTEIDSTGAHILDQICARLARQNKQLAISYLEEDSGIWHFLRDMGVFKTMSRSQIFEDTDKALEYFEDYILQELFASGRFDHETLLEKLMVLRGLSPREVSVLSKYLTFDKYDKGAEIIRQGDPGDALFFIVKGSADVTINLTGHRRRKRIQTFSAGTFFGEMALLDGKPRSANVEAREPMAIYRLSLENFNRLKQEHPHISITLLTNISHTLATRLRFADEMITELEM